MAAYPILLPAIFTCFFFFSISLSSQLQLNDGSRDLSICELDDAKLKFSRLGKISNLNFFTDKVFAQANINSNLHSSMLVIMISESVLEETIQSIDSKTLILKERQKLLDDMENKITHLQFVLSTLKNNSGLITLFTNSKFPACIIGDNNVRGSVHFTQIPNGITHVQGKITGMSPGLHGFHIHALGDTTNGCNSTGPHFNPLKKYHGAPSDGERHAGDLGNIIAGPDGVAEVSIKDWQVRDFDAFLILRS
ncbi:hypothetical protein GQ457_13G024340 [Hibiscus cannabinus]